MHDQGQKFALQLGLPGLAPLIGNRQTRLALDRGLGMKLRDQDGAIASDAIHTQAKQKLGALLLRQAESFIHVALAVPNVNAPLRFA